MMTNTHLLGTESSSSSSSSSTYSDAANYHEDNNTEVNQTHGLMNFKRYSRLGIRTSSVVGEMVKKQEAEARSKKHFQIRRSERLKERRMSPETDTKIDEPNLFAWPPQGMKPSRKWSSDDKLNVLQILVAEPFTIDVMRNIDFDKVCKKLYITTGVYHTASQLRYLLKKLKKLWPFDKYLDEKYGGSPHTKYECGGPLIFEFMDRVFRRDEAKRPLPYEVVRELRRTKVITARDEARLLRGGGCSNSSRESNLGGKYVCCEGECFRGI